MRSELGGRWCAVVLLVAFALAAPASAQGPAAGGGWTFTLEPYLWLAGADGTLKYNLPDGGGGGGVGANVGLSVNDLSFAFMLTGEARKRDWCVFGDFVTLNMDSNASEVTSVDFAGPGGQVEATVSVDAGGGTSLTGMEWELAAGYTVARGNASSLDLIAGVRYLTIEAETAWHLDAEIIGPGPGQVFQRSGSVSKRVDLWDGVVGLRGALGLGGGDWSIPFLVDVGTGSSELTWQAVAGLAYRFGWGDLHLAYRYLSYDSNVDKLLQNVTFSGPGLGARFRW
jgi:hypothetical protein